MYNANYVGIGQSDNIVQLFANTSTAFIKYLSFLTNLFLFLRSLHYWYRNI